MNLNPFYNEKRLVDKMVFDILSRGNAGRMIGEVDGRKNFLIICECYYLALHLFDFSAFASLTEKKRDRIVDSVVCQTIGDIAKIFKNMTGRDMDHESILETYNMRTQAYALTDIVIGDEGPTQIATKVFALAYFIHEARIGPQDFDITPLIAGTRARFQSDYRFLPADPFFYMTCMQMIGEIAPRTAIALLQKVR